MNTYQRPIHVYETDVMGVVHHSNYLRFCEEGRVDWFRQMGMPLNQAHEIYNLAVIESRVQYKKPFRFGDILKIEIQMKAEGAKLIIQYKLSNDQGLCAIAETLHCHVDAHIKVKRLDPKLVDLTRKSVWIETWL